MRRSSFFLLTALLLLVLNPAYARADLNKKEARKLIAKMAGFSLPANSIRVKKINMTSAAVAESTAEIEMVFRVARKGQGSWRLSELRTGQERWEQLEAIAQAARFELPIGDCDAPTQFARLAEASELTVKRARCLVAGLFGVGLPSDDVRIKEISSLGLPLASEPSALVVALVQVDFRMSKDDRGWQVVGFKSGNRTWTNLTAVPAAVDQLKRSTATNELNLIAQALDTFRRERGFFVVSDKASALIDHLSPRYLARVIRFDPWNRAYQYQGEQNRFFLSSLGPDGKPNTGDDIVVSSSTP